MTTPIRLAAAALVGVLVVGGIFAIAGRSGESGVGAPVPSPSASGRSSPSTTASPSAASPTSSGIVVPEMTRTFTSPRHGYTISYPVGWTTTAASESWSGLAPDMTSAFMDRLRGSDATLVVASAPLGNQTPDQWMAAYNASYGGDGVGECDVLPKNWPWIQIGGQRGYLDGDDCPSHDSPIADAHFSEAVTFAGGRVYLFWLDGAVNLPYFTAMLDTVTLAPSKAID